MKYIARFLFTATITGALLCGIYAALDGGGFWKMPWWVWVVAGIFWLALWGWQSRNEKDV